MAVEGLREFPDEVLRALCHPTMGIQANNKFVPSIAELREFCNREWDRLSPRVVADRTEEIKQLYGRIEPKEIQEAQKAMEREKRAKVIEGFKQLSAELRAAPDPIRKSEAVPMSKAEQKAAAELWLENQAARAAVEPPPRLSEGALKTLRLVG